MANKTYEIIIRTEGGSEGESNPVAGASSGKKAGKGNESAQNIVKGLVAYNTYVKPFVSAAAEHYISTVSLRTGATEQQQRLQFAYDMAGAAVNFGTSVLTGFAVGNVPGAIVGAVLSVSTQVISYANKVDKLNMEKDLEDISLRGLNVRAGGFAPSFSGSRSSRQ